MAEDFSQNRSFLRSNIFFIGVGAALLLIGGIFLWFYPRQEEKFERGAVVMLVPDKISQSAAIPITLPKNVVIENVQNAISFNPSIEGRWLAKTDEAIAFEPKNKLETGKHYMLDNDTLYSIDVLLFRINAVSIKRA